MSKKKVNVVEVEENTEVTEIETEKGGFLSKFRKPVSEDVEVSTDEKKRLPKWAKRTLIGVGALVSGGIGYALGAKSHSDEEEIDDNVINYATEENNDVDVTEF